MTSGTQNRVKMLVAFLQTSPGQLHGQVGVCVCTCVFDYFIKPDSNVLLKKKKKKLLLNLLGKKPLKTVITSTSKNSVSFSPVVSLVSCFCQGERALFTFRISLFTCSGSSSPGSRVLAARRHSLLLPPLKGALCSRVEPGLSPRQAAEGCAPCPDCTMLFFGSVLTS